MKLFQKTITETFISQKNELEKSTERLKPVLEVSNLKISFKQYESGLRQRLLHVINGLDIELFSGKITAIAGSSGSGKSLLAHAVMGILPSNAIFEGEIKFKGKKINSNMQAKLRGREIAFIPQSVNFLDPLMKVGKQVRLSIKNKNSPKIQRDIFSRYGLDKNVENLYPFQLSGGMARRVLVASAMTSSASLIIADEPTPGMHNPVVKETMAHLREMADKDRAVMLITHDIESALPYVDYIAVFYAGTTVEIAPIEDFRNNGDKLRHPYSRSLWLALPENGFTLKSGLQPAPSYDREECCPYNHACEISTAICSKLNPKMKTVRGAKVRCFNAT